MRATSTIDERLKKAKQEKRKEAQWVKASSVFQGGVSSNYRSPRASSEQQGEAHDRSTASFK